MPNTREVGGQQYDPEGSIFLPKDEELTLQDLGRMKFEVMLRRGAGKNLTFEEQMGLYEELIAAERSLRERNIQLGGVALSESL